jgi:hypothetical protein
MTSSHAPSTTTSAIAKLDHVARVLHSTYIRLPQVTPLVFENTSISDRTCGLRCGGESGSVASPAPPPAAAGQREKCLAKGTSCQP